MFSGIRRSGGSVMQKKLITTLILVAIVVYTWNAWFLVKPQLPQKTAGNTVSVDSSSVQFIDISKPVTFTVVARSPFESAVVKVAPPRKPTSSKRATTGTTVVQPTIPKPITQPVSSQAVEAPRIQINGIMWNSTRPLAMIKLPDGTEQMVKIGDNILGRIDIKQIE